mmetsp:Transcript_55274/g.117521  ORF Transcript_55274/g.117521 Transcript_55274/m.117521 type:complete len:237 (+) Transcript_55274:693-1403(+)
MGADRHDRGGRHVRLLRRVQRPPRDSSPVGNPGKLARGPDASGHVLQGARGRRHRPRRPPQRSVVVRRDRRDDGGAGRTGGDEPRLVRAEARLPRRHLGRGLRLLQGRRRHGPVSAIGVLPGGLPKRAIPAEGSLRGRAVGARGVRVRRGEGELDLRRERSERVRHARGAGALAADLGPGREPAGAEGECAVLPESQVPGEGAEHEEGPQPHMDGHVPRLGGRVPRRRRSVLQGVQ